MAHTHTYTVAEGGKVPSTFVGKEISWSRPDSMAEALTMGVENEATVVAAFNTQRDIVIRDRLRTYLATPGATLEGAAAIPATVKMGAPRPAGQTAKTAKPETRAKNTAAASGNKLFEKMASDDDFRARMFRDLENENDFNAWKAARTAVSAAKASPKAEPTPSPEPTPATTTAPPAEPAQSPKPATGKGKGKQ